MNKIGILIYYLWNRDGSTMKLATCGTGGTMQPWFNSNFAQNALRNNTRDIVF